jgi:hypothetical protein
VVSKTVNRLAFRKNNLTGSYAGHLAASPDNPGGASYEAMTITIDDSDSGFVMQTLPQGPTQYPSGAGCTYTAPPNVQYGEQRLISGTYSCGGSTGSFEMRNVFVTFNGFTAAFQGAWVVKGHMEGVRLGTN